VLTVSGLTKYFGDACILDGASLQLRDGERAALVGANGAGKTTLLRILAGEIRPDRGTVALTGGRRIAYLPQDAAVKPGRSLHAEMASVFGRIAEIEARQQAIADEIGSLPADDARLMRLVEEQAALHAEFERLDGYTVEAQIGRVLAGLGFRQSDWPRQTDEFSGGWQMRIALAKLLLLAPEVLLLDEPTNHLDLAATEWLEDYLAESRAAALVVSHDRYFLDRVTTRTFELRDGRIDDFAMPYSAYAAERIRRDEAQLAARDRQEEYLARQQAWIERFKAKPTKASAAKSREKMIERIERIDAPPIEPRIAFRFTPARESGREVVELANVTKSYGPQLVFDRINLLVERGDRIGLVGPNGAGKSTLLRLIARAEPPDRGRVAHGHNVQLAYFSQTQAESLDPTRTLVEEIAASAPYGISSTEIRSLLGRFLFRQEDGLKRVAFLSGGERARLALARLLLRPTNLLLLDEPTNHLDIAAREVLEAALRAFTGTVIIASHDRYLLDRVSTKIVEVGRAAIRIFPGNYSYYRQAREKIGPIAPDSVRATTAAAHQRSEPAPRPKPEREARQAADRLARLETEIEQLQARRAELEARLADPALWSKPDEAAMVVDELAALQAKIDAATSRWEQVVAAT
jgi:ATP-binding cassette subfamily F protein 3